MTAHKRLTAEQINALMLEFRAKRVRVFDFCAEKGIGACWDNAPVESFLATLKKKLAH